MKRAVPWRAERGRTCRRVGRAMVMMAAVAVLATGELSAQSRIDSQVDTTLITVGDPITMTVVLEHPAGTAVSWPDSLDLSPFEVLRAQVLPTETTAEGSRTRAIISLTAFELGTLEIPAIPVEVVGTTGETETLTTDRFGVEVVSVGADESGDIRDIRGPLSIPVSAVRLLLWVLLALAVAAVVYWLLRRRRPRDPAGPTRVAAPTARPPHEVALEALDALERSDLLQHGRVKDYHIEVSSILRTYVEHRFEVEALELTTREVLDGLERAAVDAEFTEGLGRFLKRCDLVKFAKVRPDAAASRDVLALARRLVLDSTPSAEADPTPDGGAQLAAAVTPVSVEDA